MPFGDFAVFRTDGIQERLEGKGSIALYEGDKRVKTGSGSQALMEFTNGIQVGLNEDTDFLSFSLGSWYGIYRIYFGEGRALGQNQGGRKRLEIETR